MSVLRLPRVAAGLAVWLALGLFAGVVLAAGAPALLGFRPFTVMSGSMRPALGVGDVVVTRPVLARDVRVGDVITFPDSERKELVTHRVRAIHIARSQASIVTRGDSNDASEEWAVDANGHVGRVAYHLPLVGYALAWTHGRNARLLLVVIPALLLAMIELRRIWRPRRAENVDVVDVSA
jgi:signal peptidase